MTRPKKLPAILFALICLSVSPIATSDESEFEDCEEDVNCEALNDWRRGVFGDAADEARPFRNPLTAPTYEDLDLAPFLSESDEPGTTPPRPADFIPDFGTQRSDDVMNLLQSFYGNPDACNGLSGEAWEECYLENQPTPADIPRISQEHHEQLENGDSAAAEAFQLMEGRRDSESVFLDPDGENQDEVFELANFILGNESNPVSSSLVADCETIEVPIVEEQNMTLDEFRTCERIFAPDDEHYECNAERVFRSTRAATGLSVATIESVVPLRFCELLRDEAIDECQIAACTEATETFASVCEQRCEERRQEEEDEASDDGADDETGSDEEDEPPPSCAEECTSDVNNFRSSCISARDGCDRLGAETTELCLMSCDPTDTSCIFDCQSRGSDAAANCNNRCDDEGDEAFEECPLGDPIAIDIDQEFNISTLGTSGGELPPIQFSPEADLIITRTPFARSDAFEAFTANHGVVADGASVNILSWGGPQDGYTSSFNLTGNGFTFAELFVDGYDITANRIDGCSEFFDAIADNFCTGEMTCGDAQPPCMDVGAGTGTAICRNGLSAGFIELPVPWHSSHPQALALKDIEPKPPGIQLDEMCDRLVTSSSSSVFDCSFYLSDDRLGQGETIISCYIDVYGDERCIEAIGEGLEPFLPGSGDIWLDNCRSLAGREGCTRESDRDSGVEDAIGPVTGTAYIEDIVYNCGVSEVMDVTTGVERTVECGDNERIKCMGGECAHFEESRSDISAVVSATSLVREMEKDATCFGQDEDTSVQDIGEDCEIELFRGEALECKIPIGANINITPNCCEDGFDLGADNTSFPEYMDATTAAYSAGTHAGEAGELAGHTSRDHDQGSAIDPPDESDMGDPPGPERVEPGSGMSLARKSPGGSVQAQGPFEPGLEDDTASGEVTMIPRAGHMPLGREDHYVTRPFTTPFEVAAAQSGYTPTDPKQLQEAKAATSGEPSTVRFDRAMGQGIRSAPISNDLYNQLFEPDGTPRWRRDRGGPGAWNPAPYGELPGGGPLPPPGAPGGPGALEGSKAQPSPGLLRFSPKGLSETEFKAAFMAQSGLNAAQIDQAMNLQSAGFSWGTAASIGQAVSFAYASYAIVRAIGHLVFKCDADEAKLGFAREARRCTYVGKYCARKIRLGFIRICIENREAHCCYNSPFSRIFAEQVREMEGPDYGTAKEPNCSGFTVDQIANVDMRRIDLSEWLAMLNLAGRVPNGSEPNPSGESAFAAALQSGTGSGPGSFQYGSPRRSIVGTNTPALGPDGMRSTRQRVQERINRNLDAMQNTSQRLADRRTAQFDDELTAWYGETTINPDPPRNSDIEIPDDLGERNPEELEEFNFCSAVGAPQEPYAGRILEDAFNQPISLQVHSPFSNSYRRYMNTNEGSSNRIEPGEWVAIPVEWHTRRAAYFRALSFSTFAHDESSFEVSLSRCPGHFSGEGACGNLKPAGLARRFANVWVYQYNDCHAGPGNTVYFNFRLNELSPHCQENTCPSIMLDMHGID